MVTRIRLAVCAVLAAALAIMSDTPAKAAASQDERPAVVVKVMSFNIFYGGDDLDLQTGDFCTVSDGCGQTLDAVVRVIRASRADVVGVQEAERNTAVIASRLGWYGSDRAHVLSRWPIIDPPGGDGTYVFVEASPGQVVAVANVHLPSDPYGPYLVRDGKSRDEVLAVERATRLPAIQRQLQVLPRLARREIPVLLTGDFNSPSQQDWTPAVAAVRPEVRYPVSWPVSAALARAGFRDSYREAHPDPVANPGFTWTPGSPESDPHEVFDRVDWVLHTGPVRTLASTVVGEPGDPDAGVRVAPFPSDHRGVVSTLRVQPGRPPVLVAPAQRRVTIGDRLTVAFHAPGRPGERVVLTDQRGRMLSSGGTGGRRDGSQTLSTRGAAVGEHAVALLSASGQVLSQTSVWAYPPGASATVTATKGVYRPGEPVSARWTDAPGMALDWIGVFACPAAGPCGSTSDYLVYVYTGTRIAGTAAIDRHAWLADQDWPLAPGQYVLRLLPDDGLRMVAESPRFTVRE
jgi:endonuclease/exonuclease/phosphatase family metal-dependent hydrolase